MEGKPHSSGLGLVVGEMACPALCPGLAQAAQTGLAGPGLGLASGHAPAAEPGAGHRRGTGQAGQVPSAGLG